MVVTIRVTPRTIERTVFLLIIFVFMSSTIYYSYTCDACQETGEETAAAETTEEAAEEETTAETTTTEETAETETTTEETTDTTTQETETTGSTSYKDVEITIAPFNYIIKEAGSYKKAEIDKMAFIIKNKMGSDLKGMEVKVYFWDSSSSEGFKTHPKITLSFSTIKAGTSSTQMLDTTEMIGVGNIHLTKTFKFEFVNATEGKIKTLTKTLTIEE